MSLFSKPGDQASDAGSGVGLKKRARALPFWAHGLIVAVALVLTGCGGASHQVVLYTSQDQFYAEPILRDFTLETGIQVKAVFDTESVKTAGLANRLRHEKSNPQCNVFWSNEEMHTRVLAREGVIAEDAIRAVGYRTRRVVINTNLLSPQDLPSTLLALTNEVWRGKVVLAYPLYGTTSSHFLALRQLWGDETWRRWCERLVANGAKVVDGNSVVVKLVGAGEAWIGLTDSDDVAAGKRSGLPVEQGPLTPEMLVIPNTISLIVNTPEAERLVKYLTDPRTLQKLVQVGALEGSGEDREGARVNWDKAEVDETMDILKEIFFRS